MKTASTPSERALLETPDALARVLGRYVPHTRPVPVEGLRRELRAEFARPLLQDLPLRTLLDYAREDGWAPGHETLRAVQSMRPPRYTAPNGISIMESRAKTAGAGAALDLYGLSEQEKAAFVQALPALATAARAGYTAVKASPALATAGRALGIAGRQGVKALGAGAQAMKPGLQQAGQALKPAMGAMKGFGQKAIGALNSPMGQAAGTAAMIAPALPGA